MVLCAIALPGAPAVGAGVCDTTATTPGGDWRRFGNDIWSTRNQTQEKTIGIDNVADLEVAWSFANGAGAGYITSTVVAGNCAFFTDEPAFGQAWVYAVNVNTGKLVWKSDALANVKPDPNSGVWGGRGAPVVVDGRVHVNVTTPKGPDGNAAIATAFDAATGKRLWTSKPISFGYTTNNLSGPGVFDGVHFIATIGPDVDRNAREGFALLDAKTGRTLLKRTTVPPEDYERGYVGGGMWTTPAIDPTTGYLYISSDNPNMSEDEHAYSNAILKIDIARERDGKPNPEFGEIDDSYKGNADNELFPGGYNNPVCEAIADNSGQPNGWAPYPCGQLDVDMGTSPTLIRHPSGRLMVAASQKSGTFHVVDADRMDRVWSKRMMGYPSAYQGNSGPATNDGKRVFTVANPGFVIGYDALTGEELWKSPITDGGLSHHPLSMANGVVYIVSNSGHLYGFDADTGAQLIRRSLADDSGVSCPNYSDPTTYAPFGPSAWSAGVSIANNMVIATCDGGPSAGGSVVVAYKLP
jgi:outer membrane protein assembly factor BamB